MLKIEEKKTKVLSYLDKDGVVTSTVNPNITLQRTEIKYRNTTAFPLKCTLMYLQGKIKMMGYLPPQVQLDAFSYVKPRLFTRIRPF